LQVWSGKSHEEPVDAEALIFVVTVFRGKYPRRLLGVILLIILGIILLIIGTFYSGYASHDVAV
jgi:hypothetical protein